MNTTHSKSKALKSINAKVLHNYKYTQRKTGLLVLLFIVTILIYTKSYSKISLKPDLVALNIKIETN
jgi:hypothetical protein